MNSKPNIKYYYKPADRPWISTIIETIDNEIISYIFFMGQIYNKRKTISLIRQVKLDPTLDGCYSPTIKNRYNNICYNPRSFMLSPKDIKKCTEIFPNQKTLRKINMIRHCHFTIKNL